jgi:hypothetical protein
MIMVGQSKRLSKPLTWGRRDKAVIAALIGCVVLAAIALGAYALTSGSPSRTDCVEVTFASTLGGATIHACGAHARHVCASGAFRGIEPELRAACRRAGFPYAASRAPG